MPGILEKLMSLDFLSETKQREIEFLLKIYEEIEKKLVLFRKKTHLSCLSSCGECCRTACVATSVLEMQPVAAYFWQKGEYDAWLKKIDPVDEQAHCVFYSAEVLANGGHCSIYPLRPLMCRFFGFSARRNKYHQYELMLCRKIKDHYGKTAEKVSSASFLEFQSPVPHDYFMKTYGFSPHLSTRYMNINLAFLEASHEIGLYQDLLYSTTTETQKA